MHIQPFKLTQLLTQTRQSCIHMFILQYYMSPYILYRCKSLVMYIASLVLFYLMGKSIAPRLRRSKVLHQNFRNFIFSRMYLSINKSDYKYIRQGCLKLNISVLLRNGQLQLQKNDQTDRDVAKLFNVNHTTVCRVYKRYKETNDVHRNPKSGQPRKTTEEHDRSIIDLVKLDPNRTATDVTDHTLRHFGLTISQSTAKRISNRYKLFARRPASKSILKECHRQ